MQVGAGGANIRDDLRHKILESQFTLIVAVGTYYFDFSNKKINRKKVNVTAIYTIPLPPREQLL